MKPSSANNPSTECYYTTAYFGKGMPGLCKHCGPTAIANLILSRKAAADPRDVFAAVVRLGRRRGYYWPICATRWIGGTGDIISGRYIRRACEAAGVPLGSVRFGGLARPARVRRALENGAVVYLQLHFHPRYAHHHLLLYGRESRGFRAADGWSPRPVYLTDRDLRFATYFAIY
ncbi:MAG: hypothetical protein Q4C56_01875 [Peptococcaceae bacterium]|nr:hypothetical protein [Peptococcaceae bacterium]